MRLSSFHNDHEFGILLSFYFQNRFKIMRRVSGSTIYNMPNTEYAIGHYNVFAWRGVNALSYYKNNGTQ